MIEFKPGFHHHKGIEQSILGICLLEPPAYSRASKYINADCFYFDQHRVVWCALVDMTAQAIPIDLITVTDYIERGQHIPYIEHHQTAWFLCKLTNDVIHSAHLVRWCQIIAEMWKMRVAARTTADNIGSAAAAIARLGQVDNRRKTIRFLLTYVDKSLIRKHGSIYGSRVIAGRTLRKIKVSSPLLVFLMSIVEPDITWTCGDRCHEQLTNDQVKQRLPANARFDGTTWIDKTLQYPAAWQ